MEMFFYLFAGLMVISSGLVVISKNPVYSVLWLIFTFCNGSGLMILLGAEFLAMMLVVIYVGAVAVLFLFVIMMLNIRFMDIIVQFKKNLFISMAVALIMFADLVLIICLGVQGIVLDNSQFVETDISNSSDIANHTNIMPNSQTSLREATLSSDEATLFCVIPARLNVIPAKAGILDSRLRGNDKGAGMTTLQLLRSGSASPRNDGNRVSYITNTHAIGQVLYTEYILPFQISGIILFMAMISCITLTIRHRSGVKRQDIAKQHAKNKDNCILMVKPRLSEGVEKIQYD